jgi:Phenazine biosynthesis-like protein
VQLQFVTVDVFTDRQFGGNPLAVVLNANNLSDLQMQAIAAEFNLAETTFVLPPKIPAILRMFALLPHGPRCHLLGIRMWARLLCWPGKAIYLAAPSLVRH